MPFEFGRRRLLSPRRPETQSVGALRLVPRHFEPLADAVVLGGDTAAVCTEIGHALAEDGVSLHEALDGLRLTYELVGGQEPAYGASEALALSWSEASLQYLHALSCEDPLTGLASLAHVRSRLSEIYREADRRGDTVATAYALVIVELTAHRLDDCAAGRFDRALELAGVAQCLRHVYSGGETLGRLGLHRGVAVVRRSPNVGDSVAVLRTLLADWGRQSRSALRARVWIEQLPVDNDAAARLLDELAR